MGSPDRLSYTCIGDNVNLATLLEGLNKKYGTTNLISQYTFELSSNKYCCRALDIVKIHGKNDPIKIYELIGLNNQVSSAISQSVNQFNEALELFADHQFHRAQILFTEFNESWKKVKMTQNDDIAALKHIKQAQIFISKPPSSDWDGSTNLHEN